MYLTKEQKSILLALCLGDGCLRKPNQGSVQLEIGHSTKQLEYCIWKRDLVYSILGGRKPPKVAIKKVKLKNYKEYEACRFTKTHPYFKELRNKLYCNGVKTITKDILEMLTPQCLAIWYMDDGSFYKKDNEDGTKSICFDLRISTDCFSKEENEMIVDYLYTTYGIKFYTYKYHPERNGGAWILRARKEAAIKFIDLIKPYVIPSMQYKIEYKSNNTQERETSVNTTDEDIV